MDRLIFTSLSGQKYIDQRVQQISNEIANVSTTGFKKEFAAATQTYRYDAAVAAAACVMRLLPRAEAGQKVIDSGLDIAPAPAETRERADAFGNRVTSVRIDAPHRELRVSALSRVAVERPAPPAAARKT